VLKTETDTPVERQLLRTKSGDRRAFEGLILANSARAYRTAYRLLGNMEDVRRLWQAIDGLSESHRRVLIMKHFDNLSYAEMAEILSVPIGTVMSRLYHARKRLGEIYDNL